MKCFSSSLWCLLVLVSASVADRARAQCPDWTPGFHVDGVDKQVLAAAQFDDGSGPKLVVGGRYITSAGGSAVRNIAAWDGTSWSSLGAGINAPAAASVYALATFDDGSGPALYAAGYFSQAGGTGASSIARWNGSTWSPLGTGIVGTVHELAVFDDGAGPALYAAGIFGTAGGASANNIAKWNGSTWSALGSGLQGDSNLVVDSLAVFDDGSGLALFAAGTFATAGGSAANNIAKWNGSSWSPLGIGTDGNVRALSAFDDGSGPALYASGAFSGAGGIPTPGLARWNGAGWSAFGASVSGIILQLLVFDDGSGPALHAAGHFSGGSLGAQWIAKWNGSDWAPLAGGTNGEVDALTLYDDGSGARLVAAGQFGFAGGVHANNVARWNGVSWSSFGRGAGLDNGPLAMTPFDDGSGRALFVGGQMTAAGGTSVNRIAKWDGSSWAPLGSGVQSSTTTPATVRALAVFADASGAALYAGGYFATAGGHPAANIAKWDGNAWSALGSGIGGASYERVDSLAVYDDGSGPALYAGGSFTVAGGASANHIARWDGSTWTALGTGIQGPYNNTSAYALAVYDDGSGPALYAGGSFATAGGLPAANIAKWNGSTWSALGSGTDHIVFALAVADVGSGPALYAGGFFSSAGGTAAERIARWDGSSWSALGVGFSGGAQVAALAAFDDGSGPALFAGGRFTTTGSLAVSNIAKWDGSAWSALGAGVVYPPPLDSLVTSLAPFDGASSRSLYVGGTFTRSGGLPANFIAAWSACPGSGTGQPFCFGDGTGAACPCANDGLPGHGCRNSSAIRGAELTATGQPSLAADGLVLRSEFEVHNAASVFLQGTLAIAPVLFGDGLRCVGGALKRLYLLSASPGGIVSAPIAGALSVSARSAQLGDPILAGTRRRYQVYYRDSDPSFCPLPQGSTFNISNGLSVLWTP